MKNVWFAAVSVAAALFCGCRHTHVDQVRPSDGRQDWYKDIQANYPGFRPPRLVSPGISGYSGSAVKPAAQAPAEKYSAMDSDIEAVPVDPEIKPEVKPEAPAAEVKPEVKPEAPAAEVKNDAPEAKPEAKAEVKPEAKPETAKIEPPDPTGSDIYEVQYGDTLGAISKKFYGSARHTNLIKKANSDIITNANVLKPGMKLIIPKL